MQIHGCTSTAPVRYMCISSWGIVMQGLTTRNVLDFGQPSAAPLYTAMLNSKGRQLFDLFLYRDASDHNAVLVDCPAQSSTKLLSLLQKFKLRSAVTIDDASKEFSMVAAWGTPAQQDQTQGACRHTHAVQGLTQPLLVLGTL